uniref:Uncharacterized protein n=1 Tax=Plectus sambesii TaxID=2011161 RepID=A0A914VM43_9BILA
MMKILIFCSLIVATASLQCYQGWDDEGAERRECSDGDAVCCFKYQKGGTYERRAQFACVYNKNLCTEAGVLGKMCYNTGHSTYVCYCKDADDEHCAPVAGLIEPSNITASASETA